MSEACTYEGCTVAETGRCALEKDPLNCPNRNIQFAPRRGELESTNVDNGGGGDDSSAIGAPVLTPPIQNPAFPSSDTLKPATLEAMMPARYMTLVGILGDPDSGKTSCLASLYLLVANAQLTGWAFADSCSLRAFEDISRGARRWSAGNPPAEMTSHTQMADDRQPGFLHIKLRRISDQRLVDLILPDLPGEWTKSFVRTSRSDRLDFLKRADVVWIVVDGRTLTDKTRRQGVITSLGQLVGRLRSLVNGKMPRLLLVATHRDAGDITNDVLNRVHGEIAKHNATVEIFPVASFSESETCRPGSGLAELVDATVRQDSALPVFWPVTQPKQNIRSFFAYRRDR